MFSNVPKLPTAMKHTLILSLLCCLLLAYFGGLPVEGQRRLPPHHQAQNRQKDPGLGAEVLAKTAHSRRRRAAILKDSNRLWPGGVVPYHFNVTWWFSSAQRYFLNDVLDFIEEQTCIDFRANTTVDENWVTIGDCWGSQWAGWNSGCMSHLGNKKQGEQFICLSGGGDCKTPGLMFHEIGHTLGLMHEHQRDDRDDHITINFHNTQNGMESAFNKKSNSEYTRTPYDMASVMHYGRKAFSRNNEYTVNAKSNSAEDNAKIGYVKLKMMSYYDIKLLNEMYNCKAKGNCSPDTECQDGFIDKHCNCITEQAYYKKTCVDIWDVKQWGSPGDCPKWKSWGECTKNEVWMAFYCRASCKACNYEPHA